MRQLDPLTAQQVEGNHKAMLFMCDLLEGIADHLPGNVDRQQCLAVAGTLGELVHQAQHYEEEALFPLLRDGLGFGDELGETLDRLRIEHQTDQSYAEDIGDMLRAYGEGHPNVAADTAGFMLRGFFEALRRHIAFERQLLLPLVKLARLREN
jgi:hemerythrin-like domain-containing protein